MSVIEDKIMRFADKERHQIFIEPESSLTNEMYVQGMSSSLPFDVQLEMYKSVIGLEKVKIMRFAYAIEYDPTCLPIGVSLASAFSCLSKSLCSALATS